MFLIVINSVIDVPPCARCYEVTEHVCRVVREQLSVCGAANIFQLGFSWEEDEFRGWRKWKVWRFLIGHSEATGKLNKRDKLKNPL